MIFTNNELRKEEVLEGIKLCKEFKTVWTNGAAVVSHKNGRERRLDNLIETLEKMLTLAGKKV